MAKKWNSKAPEAGESSGKLPEPLEQASGLLNAVRQLYAWVRKRWGRAAGGLIVCGVLVALVWWGWPELKERPGIEPLAEWFEEIITPIPACGGQNFCVAVANLQNDPDDKFGAAIVDAVENLQDIASRMAGCFFSFLGFTVTAQIARAVVLVAGIAVTIAAIDAGFHDGFLLNNIPARPSHKTEGSRRLPKMRIAQRAAGRARSAATAGLARRASGGNATALRKGVILENWNVGSGGGRDVMVQGGSQFSILVKYQKLTIREDPV
jgi:hypothetical protein